MTENWSRDNISINQSTQTNEQSNSGKTAIKCAIALDLNEPWTLKVLPQTLTSVQSSAALGPFSLVGRSIEQGTGAIVQPGMQVMAGPVK